MFITQELSFYIPKPIPTFSIRFTILQEAPQIKEHSSEQKYVRRFTIGACRATYNPKYLLNTLS